MTDLTARDIFVLSCAAAITLVVAHLGVVAVQDLGAFMADLNAGRV